MIDSITQQKHLLDAVQLNVLLKDILIYKKKFKFDAHFIQYQTALKIIWERPTKHLRNKIYFYKQNCSMSLKGLNFFS